MKVTTYGLDLAKRLFQVHWVDMVTGEICRRQLKRAEVGSFLPTARRRWWRWRPAAARTTGGGAKGYGHEVRLIAAQFVRPFVKSNKTDAADAQAIWEAAQRPGMKFVAVKSEGQQSVLTLHRMREQLVKMRTMQVNQLRGLLYEFGAELPQGRRRGIERIPGELAKLEGIVSALVIEMIRGQLKRIEAFDQDIAEMEKKLAIWKREDQAVRRLMEIPGVGLLSATAAVATMGDAGGVQVGSGVRCFPGVGAAAERHRWPGEAAGDQQTWGCVSAHPAIHGARSVITNAKERPVWLEKLRSRRPLNVAVVALANKMARTMWALLAHDRTYQKDYVARAA